MPILPRTVSVSSAKSLVSSKWRQFADDTSFHGVKGFVDSTNIFYKFMWALIITSCATAFCYQTYQLAAAYEKENTTIEITTLQGPYKPPRIIINVPTNLLFRYERPNNSSLPEMDLETLRYVEQALRFDNDNSQDVQALAGGRKKFENYLVTNKLPWAQALEPYILDIGPWMMFRQDEDGASGLRIGRRLVWYPVTYYLIEPKSETKKQSISTSLPKYSTDQTHTMMLEWRWSPIGRTREFKLMSFEVVTDSFQLEPGKQYKLTFNIFGNKLWNSRRKPCRKSADFHYGIYKQCECRESCYAKAVLERHPHVCFTPVDTRGSLFSTYPKGRPCWLDGRKESNESTKRHTTLTRSKDLLAQLTQAELDDISRAYEHCVNVTCFNYCHTLTSQYQLSSGVLTSDGWQNQTVLTFEWPSPDGVLIFEEKPLFTAESLVGQLGGLTGVWLGASIISFLEILYFCLCCCCCCIENNVAEDETIGAAEPARTVESTRF